MYNAKLENFEDRKFRSMSYAWSWEATQALPLASLSNNSVHVLNTPETELNSQKIKQLNSEIWDV